MFAVSQDDKVTVMMVRRTGTGTGPKLAVENS